LVIVVENILLCHATPLAVKDGAYPEQQSLLSQIEPILSFLCGGRFPLRSCTGERSTLADLTLPE
jgi:hypothetical protein